MNTAEKKYCFSSADDFYDSVIGKDVFCNICDNYFYRYDRYLFQDNYQIIFAKYCIKIGIIEKFQKYHYFCEHCLVKYPILSEQNTRNLFMFCIYNKFDEDYVRAVIQDHIDKFLKFKLLMISLITQRNEFEQFEKKILQKYREPVGELSDQIKESKKVGDKCRIEQLSRKRLKVTRERNVELQNVRCLLEKNGDEYDKARLLSEDFNKYLIKTADAY